VEQRPAFEKTTTILSNYDVNALMKVKNRKAPSSSGILPKMGMNNSEFCELLRTI